MKEMFEASVDGEAYDMEKFGQYFRPAGMSQATGDPNKTPAAAPVAQPVTAPVAETAPAPAEPVTPAPAPEASTAPEAQNRAQDILAQIRSRQN